MFLGLKSIQKLVETEESFIYEVKDRNDLTKVIKVLKDNGFNGVLGELNEAYIDRCIVSSLKSHEKYCICYFSVGNDRVIARAGVSLAKKALKNYYIAFLDEEEVVMF